MPVAPTIPAPVSRAAVCALLALLVLLAIPGAARADRPFSVRYSENTTGNVTAAANTLMTCPAGAANCAAAQAGGASNNNDFNMTMVDIDNDPTTLNSSSANLVLPPGAVVRWAGLYWGGDAKTTGPPQNGTWTDARRRTVRFRTPVSFGTLGPVGTTLDTTGQTGQYAGRYQVFQDVTLLVRMAGAGTYTVGDVAADTGSDHYAGWSLVVVYRDPAQPARNLTVLDGLTTIVSNAPPTSIPVSGFQTPPAGPVKTTVGTVSWEGDRAYVNDTARLNSTLLTNAANPSNNYFNSSISRLGANITTKFPDFVNQLGFDADIVDADGVLPNGATAASINLTTGSDQYMPAVVTFATELFAPNVTALKSVSNVTHPGGPNRAGDTLRYTVSYDNSSGLDGATNFIIDDAIPGNATYKPGTLRILQGGAPASPTDAIGDDTAEFNPATDAVRFRVGTGANATQGGLLGAAGNPPSTATVTFDVTVDAVPDRSEILNTATASYLTQSLGVPVEGKATNTVRTVVAAPDLTIRKSHAPPFVAGDPSTFTITVPNAGLLATDGSTVTVTDAFPSAGFSAITNPQGSGWNCSIAGLTLTCTRSDVLAAGATYPPITVEGIVRDPAPSAIANTATVAGGGDSNPANNSVTDEGGTSAQADLSVVKTVRDDVVLSGADVTFDLVVRNGGPSTAVGATLQDILGAGYANVRVDAPAGVTCSAAVICNLGNLPRNAVRHITITATVTTSNATKTNTASVDATTTDPNPANNSSSATFTIPASADLRLVKTSAPAEPVAGSAGGLAYTLTVDNLGPDTADDVTVFDNLPAQFTPTTITAPGFSCNSPAKGGELVCTRAALSVAASPQTITIVGTVDAATSAGQPVFNGASVTARTGDPDGSNNADETTNITANSADVSILKEAANGNTIDGQPTNTWSNGALTHWNLTVTNHGPSAATGVVVTDPIPAHFVSLGSSITDVTGSGTDFVCTLQAGPARFVCTLASLPAGQTRTLSLNLQHDGLGGGPVTNAATVTTTSTDPDQGNNAASAPGVIKPEIDLAAVKLALPLTPAVGEDVTYTVTVTNAGPDTATGVSLTDPIPAGMTPVTIPPACTGTAPMVCTLPNLAAGAETGITFVLRPDASLAGQRVDNTATVSGTQSDSDPTNNSSTATINVGALVDLGIAKSTDSSPVNVGGDVTYRLSVSNNGPNDATGVRITDPVPTGMEFVGGDDGCEAVSGVVTCTIGDLPYDETVTRTVILRAGVTLAGATGVLNTATVAGDQPDPNEQNDSSTAAIDVNPAVSLRLQKTPNTTSPAAGGQVTYTLVVVNRGPSTATALVLTDPLPAGLTLVSATPSQGTCLTGATVNCQLGSLAALGSAQVVVVANVGADQAGKPITNTATVDAAEPDLTTAGKTATATVTPVAPPSPVLNYNLSVTKTASAATPVVGQPLTYTIKVANAGPGPAEGVTLTDTPSGPLTVTSATASQGTCTTVSPVTCSLGTIPAGSTVTVTLVVVPTASGPLRNTASATASGPPGAVDTDPVNSSGVKDVSVSGATARLRIAKTASYAQVRTGQPFSYAITVRSTGRGAAQAVKVCDALPGRVAFVAASAGARRSGRTVCWRVASLAPGAQRRFTISVRALSVTTSTRVTNTATATATRVAAVRDGATVTIRPARRSTAPTFTG